MPEQSEQIAEIRPEGSDHPLPDGWVAEPLRWQGQAMEIAFDARRFKVARITSSWLDRHDRRRLFGGAGWHQLGVDQEGAELWVAERDPVADASRLGRLRTRRPEPATPALGLG